MTTKPRQHRKPLGTTCTTRCRWHGGGEPKLLDLMVTASGLVYRIVGVEESKPQVPPVYRLTFERVAFEALAEVEPERVHDFAWDSRR